jgi:large subunit ribosomal protein L10
MAITRQKKESILKNLTEQFKKAGFVVFVNFHGLNTAASRELRKLMGTIGAKYQVAKKTLIKKALESLAQGGISDEAPELKGEIGLIFSQDAISTSKTLSDFIKEHKELTIAGGILENQFVVPMKITEFSAIPSREILLAKLVYLINSPLQRMVVTLNGPIRNFISVLRQYKALRWP